LFKHRTVNVRGVVEV